MNNNSAKLDYNGKTYDLPIVRGTEKEIGIDISKLRAQSGLTTIDIGYKNTGSAKSEITFIEGKKGILRYRGYPIEQLAEHADFLEVAHLLIFKKLPTKDELARFKETIGNHAIVDEEVKDILDGFPRSAHPMGVLSSLTCSLTAFYPKPLNINDPNSIYNGVAKIMAKFPIIAAWTYSKITGLPLNYSDPSISYASNILKLMFSIPTKPYKIDEATSKALDKLLILHADHEQNCSTSTVRIVGSSHAGLFASISSGVSALWGPLHGGANQAVIEMLENIISDGGDIDKYLYKAKDKKDPFRLMGFGHRVYKNFDPRAKIIKSSADEVLSKLGIKNDPILELAKKLEKMALEDEYFIKRKLFPNVDFYSGIIYRALGIPLQMFIVMFALGRLPGWIAQWLEMRKQKHPIIRPRQIYIGKTARDFLPIEDR